MRYPCDPPGRRDSLEGAFRSLASHPAQESARVGFPLARVHDDLGLATRVPGLCADRDEASPPSKLARSGAWLAMRSPRPSGPKKTTAVRITSFGVRRVRAASRIMEMSSRRGRRASTLLQISASMSRPVTLTG